MSKALLLIDIQNDYFSGGRNELYEPDKALEATLKVLNAFREAQLPVIHIQHINTREGATFFLPGTEGAEIHPAIKPQREEAILIKHMPNSFFETGLDGLLEKKGITHLYVCGMMTHMCIDTTVRRAKDYGLQVSLIQDACATKDLTLEREVLPAKLVQQVYLAGLSPMFAKLLHSDDVKV